MLRYRVGRLEGYIGDWLSTLLSFFGGTFFFANLMWVWTDSGQLEI